MRAVPRMVSSRSSSSAAPGAGEAAQLAQGQLEVAGADLDIVGEIAELPLVPDLDRAPVPALVLPDPHALGVVAVGAERRGAGGADHLAAALVPLLLLRQPLGQRAHQLLEAAEALDLGLLLLGQQPLGLLAQPVVGYVAQDLGQPLHAVEEVAKGEVEPVVVRLVLDQAEPAQRVEVVERAMDDARVQRGKQVQQLAQRDRQPAGAQLEEEVDEHQRAGR